mmetsp:Transcript_3144/g.5847  ORF Transcript_3144/g.5847 Transcript_3144/m.5847 type:complete len:235 (-) Transcript_3144:105-809(-)
MYTQILVIFIFMVTFAIFPTEIAAVQKDSDRRCRQWAERGECDKNPNYMRRECQTSCEWYDNKIGLENNSNIDGITSFFQLSAKNIDGNDFDFENLKGKITVVVNVASRCGYTESHYRGLKQLYDSVKSTENVEILAFPCNQFGRQEPGTCEEIKRFATQDKGAEYRLMDKIDVNGPNAHTVYKFLKREAGPPTISWNFATYFVVSPEGAIRSYSGVEPMDLQKLIFEMLEKEL